MQLLLRLWAAKQLEPHSASHIPHQRLVIGGISWLSFCRGFFYIPLPLLLHSTHQTPSPRA